MERLIHNGKLGVFYTDEELSLLGLVFSGTAVVLTNDPQLLDLKFFIGIDTIERQEALRKIIKDFLPFINANIGLCWLPLYIAFTFFLGKQYLFKDYVSFFSDIEALMPNLLNNINTKEKKPCYKRYESLIKSLTEECGKWYIYQGTNLPPVNKWTASQYVYQVDDDWRNIVINQTIPILKELQKIALL